MHHGEDMEKLAGRLRRLRTQRGWSLADLQAKTGIAKSYLWRLEQTDEKAAVQPSAPTLLKVAGAFGITVSELLGETPVADAAPGETGPEVSESLRKFIQLRAKANKPLTQQEIWGLAAVNSRGRVPRTAEDWDFIMRSIERATS